MSYGRGASITSVIVLSLESCALWLIFEFRPHCGTLHSPISAFPTPQPVSSRRKSGAEKQLLAKTLREDIGLHVSSRWFFYMHRLALVRPWL